MNDIDESRFVVTGDWLTYDVGCHTCGTGPDGHFGAHEPGCGLEPVCRLSEIPDLVAERDAARAEVARLRAAVWDEAADLADSVIVSWQGVAGLRPEAQEPHPAALRAAGARRTLVVLRSRMSEAFADRHTALAVPTDEGGSHCEAGDGG